jgi:hypothetical protein
MSSSLKPTSLANSGWRRKNGGGRRFTHNRQPWLVDLREGGVITLYADRTRLLPETDPFGRQILIGHGAFLELLVLALAQQGLAATVQLFPQGDLPPTLAAWDDRPIARIALGTPGSAKPDPFAPWNPRSPCPPLSVKDIFERFAFIRAVDRKVRAVNGDDVGDVDTVGQPDQGRVGQIHGAIRVLAHQGGQPQQVVG